ncbi:MAG: DUF1800 domain-containing protein [Fimbriimonadaceae bacterium]|nr:DUF1800 domain-containing protein [Fimbriimonadaceae bacterium]
MNHKEQVAHLCRRLAFGTTIEERERFDRMSIADITDELLDIDKADEFPIHPFEFFWDQNGAFQNQPSRVSAFWCLRMAFGNRPAKDKLMVFLHDHFAVSGVKVENGALMLGYLQALEANATKPFAEILEAMTADPAMMFWLDLTTNVRGRPNENYAREVLELFTLGVDGGYTEEDIRELSRAFTGWSIRVAIDAVDPESRKNQLLEYVRNGWPIAAGSFAEGLHDPGPYRILGETKSYDTAGICARLAADPTTARHLSQKLLEYYLWPNPEPSLVEKFAKVFLAEKGNLVEVVRAIAKSEEFWSDRAHRAIIKCPLDFLIPMIRQLVTKTAVFSLRSPDAKLDTPLPQALLNLALALPTLTNRMGMLPLYPPDVAGWNWGSGWISSAAMLDRIKIAEAFTNQGAGRSATDNLTAQSVRRGIKTNEGMVDILFELFDVTADDSSRKSLIDECERLGLASKIGNLDATSAALRPVLRSLFAMPSFQMM